MATPKANMSTSTVENIDDLLHLASEYYKQEDFENALHAWSDAIAIDPQRADLYVRRGNLLREQEDLNSAIEDYSEAIRLNRQFGLAYYGRGLAHAAQHNYHRAIHDFSEAIHLHPTYATAYSNRGIARAMQFDYENAIEDFATAIELDPSLAEPYMNRGNVHEAQGNYEDALHDYTAAIEQNPQHELTFFNRGNIRRKQGDIEGAIEDYQQYLTLGGGEQHGNRSEVELWVRDLHKVSESGESLFDEPANNAFDMPVPPISVVPIPTEDRTSTSTGTLPNIPPNIRGTQSNIQIDANRNFLYDPDLEPEPAPTSLPELRQTGTVPKVNIDEALDDVSYEQEFVPAQADFEQKFAPIPSDFEQEFAPAQADFDQEFAPIPVDEDELSNSGTAPDYTNDFSAAQSYGTGTLQEQDATFDDASDFAKARGFWDTIADKEYEGRPQTGMLGNVNEQAASSNSGQFEEPLFGSDYAAGTPAPSQHANADHFAENTEAADTPSTMFNRNFADYLDLSYATKEAQGNGAADDYDDYGANANDAYFPQPELDTLTDDFEQAQNSDTANERFPGYEPPTGNTGFLGEQKFTGDLQNERFPGYEPPPKTTDYLGEREFTPELENERFPGYEPPTGNTGYLGASDFAQQDEPELGDNILPPPGTGWL